MKKNTKNIEIVAGVELDKYKQLEDIYTELLNKHVDALHYFNKIEEERDELLTKVYLYENLLNDNNRLLETIDIHHIEKYLRKKKLEHLNK